VAERLPLPEGAGGDRFVEDFFKRSPERRTRDARVYIVIAR
jgi:hypothetical protein